jgi:putative PEP-CTERM system TPR-repeat lipoprotein
MSSRIQGIGFILLVIILSACAENKSAAELVLEAKQSITENNFSEAEISLKKVIRLSPKHSEARYLLGSLYSTMERNNSAEKEFLKAIEYGVNTENITLDLASIYVKVGKNRETIELIKDVNFIEESSLILSHILVGKAYLNLQKMDRAREAFDVANDINAESSFSLYGSAIKSSMDKDFLRAEAIIDGILDEEDTYAEAWLLKAKFSERSERLEDAISAYQSFLKLRPLAHSIKLLVAKNYLLLNKLDESEVIVDDLLKLNINNPTTNLIKARIALERSQYENVGKYANVALNVMSSNTLALYLLGLSHFYLEEYEQAYDKLNQATLNLPKNHPSHRFLILTMFRLGYIDQLIKAIDRFEGFYPHESELVSELASSLLKVDQFNMKESQLLYEKALDLDPGNSKAMTRLGIIKLLNNQADGLKDIKAANEFEASDNAAVLTLATVYMSTNEPEKSLKTIDSWLEKHPKDIKVLLLKVKAFNALKQPHSALTLLKNISQLSSRNVENYVMIGQQYFFLNQYIEAENALEQALDLGENSKAVYDFLFRIKVKLSKKENFLNYLAEVADVDSLLIWPRIILAQQSLITGDAEKSLYWLSTIKEEDTLPADYFATVLNSYFSLNDKENLNQEANKWQQQEPNNLQSYMMQIEMLDKWKDIELALKVTRKARRQDTLRNSTVLLLLDVRYSLSLGKNDEIASQIGALKKRLPNNAQALQLIGIYSLMEKRYEIAKSNMQASYQIEKSVKTSLLLAKSYQHAESANKAVSFLEQTPENIRTNSAVLKLLLELYMETSPIKAEAIYQKQLSTEPDNLTALNNIAVLFTKKGDLVNAIKYAEQAKGLAPEHPEILDTLGVALFKNIQILEALAVLEKAYEIGGSAAIKLHYAQALAKNKQLDRAKDVISELTEVERIDFASEIQQLQN